jgi:hypothetical protein
MKVSRFKSTSRFILSLRPRSRRDDHPQSDNVTTTTTENSPGDGSGGSVFQNARKACQQVHFKGGASRIRLH